MAPLACTGLPCSAQESWLPQAHLASSPTRLLGLEMGGSRGLSQKRMGTCRFVRSSLGRKEGLPQILPLPSARAAGETNSISKVL